MEGMNINVRLDVSTIDYVEITGIGVYIKNLGRNLLNIPALNLTGSYKVSRIKRLNQIKSHIPGLSLSPFIPGLTDYLQSKPMIFHGPDFRVPLSLSKNFKKVVTVHDLLVFHKDLVDEDFSKWGMERLSKTILQAKPDVVITVSDFIKNEFLNLYPQYEGHVHTIYHGVDHLTIENQGEIYDFPYVLFVGGLEKRKSVMQVIKAWETLDTRYKDLKLIIVGSKGNSEKEAKKTLRYIKESKAGSQIIYKGFVNDVALNSLYQYAVASVYPSLYEGFGIPVLESMYQNCPVITTNFGAVKEASGEAALHVDATDYEEIAENVIRLLEDDDLRNTMVGRGKNHVQQFTWKQCAQETFEVYKKLL